ncbi:phosphotransferase [Actinoplanes sp. NPDC023714]|uniref:phosphotransferase enzyme family protein n=1 Tax=Actinoplanes sp. NPDC023714 TaxID=3154322 RepID=UPI0034051762
MTGTPERPRAAAGVPPEAHRREVLRRWRLVPGPVLGARATTTWQVRRGRTPLVLKQLPASVSPDWAYPIRVARALRERGWPAPVPVEEPVTAGGSTWLLLPMLPGRPRAAGPVEQRDRGRLLARLHASLADTGITGRRGGFPDLAAGLVDPALEETLCRYETRFPEPGRLLRVCRDATAAWFAAHDTSAAPRGVIHGDFTPWNLLFDGDRLTGLLDFETCHHTFQVADFALSWRGRYAEVIRGYREVRPLSALEDALIRPAFRAWLFLGAADATDFSWQLGKLAHDPEMIRLASYRPRML